MKTINIGAAALAGFVGLLTSGQVYAQSAGSDSEIALLKQQLRLMEQKLDKMQWTKPLAR